MALVYTELYHNDFLGVNQSPLAGWTMRPHSSASVLQQFNNLGTSTTVDLGDGQGTFDSVVPSDVYQEITMYDMGTGQGGTFIYLRGGQGGGDFTPCYVFEIGGGFNTANCEYSVYQFDASHNFVHFWADTVLGALNLHRGSKIHVGVKGDYATGKLYLDLDGVNIFTGNLADSPAFISGGGIGWQIYLNNHPSPPNVNLFSVSRWAAGSITDSQSDYYPHYAPPYFANHQFGFNPISGYTEFAEIVSGPIELDSTTFKTLGGNSFVIQNPGRSA